MTFKTKTPRLHGDKKLLYSNILGSGMPLVILHGFLGMGDNWKTLGRRFGDNGFEVHMIDQRNHGRSFRADGMSYALMAEDIEAYCRHHGLENIALIGHSMGGKTAMYFATSHPQLVSRLVITDISPRAYGQHHRDILAGLSSLDFDRIKSRGEADKQLARHVPEPGTRQFLLKNLYRERPDRFALRINLPVLVKNIEEVGRALPDGAVFNGETLFLRGEKSGYIQSKDKPIIQRHFPNATIQTVPEAGHWVHAENPEGFYEALMAFLS